VSQPLLSDLKLSQPRRFSVDLFLVTSILRLKIGGTHSNVTHSDTAQTYQDRSEQQ